MPKIELLRTSESLYAASDFERINGVYRAHLEIPLGPPDLRSGERISLAFVRSLVLFGAKAMPPVATCRWAHASGRIFWEGWSGAMYRHSTVLYQYQKVEPGATITCDLHTHNPDDARDLVAIVQGAWRLIRGSQAVDEG